MKNVGFIDRIIRLVLVVFIIIGYFLGYIGGIGALILAVVALLLLATGLMGACPIYGALDISTYKKRKAKKTR